MELKSFLLPALKISRDSPIKLLYEDILWGKQTKPFKVIKATRDKQFKFCLPHVYIWYIRLFHRGDRYPAVHFKRKWKIVRTNIRPCQTDFILHMLCSFRSEFLTGHSLKIFGCVAFIHYFNAEHSLDYIFHSHDTAHAAIFIGYY